MGHREGAHRPPRLLLFRSLGPDPPTASSTMRAVATASPSSPPNAHHAAPGSGGVEGRRVLEGEQRHLVAGHPCRAHYARLARNRREGVERHLRVARLRLGRRRGRNCRAAASSVSEQHAASPRAPAPSVSPAATTATAARRALRLACNTPPIVSLLTARTCTRALNRGRSVSPRHRSPFQSRNEPEAEAREPRLTGDRISGSKQGSWRGAVKSAHADGHYVPWRRRWVVGARSSHAHVPRRGPGGLAGYSVFEPEEGWRASC